MRCRRKFAVEMFGIWMDLAHLQMEPRVSKSKMNLKLQL